MNIFTIDLQNVIIKRKKGENMKKILSLILCAILINTSILAFAADDVAVEHLFLPKKLAKKTPTNVVNKSDTLVSVLEYNTMQLTFAENFSSKTAKVGDEITFLLENGAYTNEGTEVLPPSSKVIAKISQIEKPKAFNRSGKVHLDFKYVELPDGTQIPIKAKLFSKKDFLYRGKLNAIGKGVGSTLGGMAIGTAAGCGIGIAAGAVIVGGFAIGMPVGFAVGGAIGLIAPGLNYKAKAGDKVNIQLLDDLNIQK